MQSIELLAERMNNFDYQYLMGARNTYYKALSEITKIKNAIEPLSENERRELSALLNVEASKLEFHFDFIAPKPVSPRSKVFKSAWFYLRKGIYTTFSECLKAAWRAYRIRKSLKQGKASFTYRKATGELRPSVGTLNGNLFTFTRKGTKKESKPDLIKYFDLDSNSFRAFRIERLISIH